MAEFSSWFFCCASKNHFPETYLLMTSLQQWDQSFVIVSITALRYVLPPIKKLVTFLFWTATKTNYTSKCSDFQKKLINTITTNIFYLRFKENNENDMAAQVFWAVFIPTAGRALSAQQQISMVLPFHPLYFPWSEPILVKLWSINDLNKSLTVSPLRTSTTHIHCWEMDAVKVLPQMSWWSGGHLCHLWTSRTSLRWHWDRW